MNKNTQHADPKAYADGVPVYCAHDEIVDVAALIPNPRNPNTHPDEQIRLLGSIIRHQGWRAPITVSTRSGFIVKGHGRLSAALLEGFKEVPVDFQNYATEADEYADLVADNRIAELAEIDQKKLAEIFAEIDTTELPIEMTGYTEKEAEDIVAALNDALANEQDEQKEPDEIPETPEPEQAITKAGDMWIIGRHRLLCGDSTDRATVEKLIGDELVDCVFTDPPYGMKKESEGVANDNLNYDDLLEFNKLWVPLSFDCLKDMGSWYCWGIDEPLMDMYSHILKPMKKENKIVMRNYITWAKHSAFGMKSPEILSYPKETEKCWFVVKGQDWNNNNAEFFNYKYQPVLDYLRGEAERVGLTSGRLNELTGVQMWGHWFSRSQFTVIPEWHYATLQKEYNKAGAFLKSHKEVRDLIGAVDMKKMPEKPYFDCTWFDDGDIPLTDVWRQSTTTIKEREDTGGHATPKPVALCQRAIKTSTPVNGTVLDLFGGSGSTMIACEEIARTCYMMELEPKYCDVIVRRYIRTTGKTDVRLIRDGKEQDREVFEGIMSE